MDYTHAEVVGLANFILILIMLLSSAHAAAQHETLLGSEHIELNALETRSYKADDDFLIIIQNLSKHQAYEHSRVDYTLNGLDALPTSTRKYATISLRRGDILQLKNITDSKVQIMYYRSFTVLYIAFTLLVISSIGFLVAFSYSFTYRNFSYLYEALFSLSVVFEIFFHFYAHKWDYISFSIYCSMFMLMLWKDLRIRTIIFGICVVCVGFEIWLWDRLPGRMNIEVATIYNKLIALVCVVKSTINIVRRRQILVSVTGYGNVASAALITDVFQNLVALYPLTQCVYILISTGSLILNSVKNERNARLAHNEIKKKNQEILELNQGLEHKVAEQTQDIRSLLDNLPQGVLSVGAGCLIMKDFSRVLPSILQTDEVAERDFKTLVIDPIENMTPDEKDQFFQTVGICVGGDPINFILNEDKLPRLLKHKGRWLQCTYSPIVTEQGMTEKINITMLDITREKASEEQAEIDREKLTIVAELINVKNLRPAEFFESMRSLLSDVMAKVEPTPPQSAIRSMMIGLHTMKGVARSYGFRQLSDRVHGAEQLYAAILQDQSVFDRTQALHDLQSIENILELYRTVYTDTLERKLDDTGGLMDRLDSILQELEQSGRLKPEHRAVLLDLKETLASRREITLKTLLQDAFRHLPTLAHDLGKDVPRLAIEGEDFVLDAREEQVLKNAFVHLLRNALDHGIEPAHERVQLQKPASGLIQITVDSRDAGIRLIRLKDDGRGLAMAKLRQVGEAKGLIKPGANLQTVAQLIFHPGLSTAQQLSDVSGRGIGMDAVQNFLEGLGGSLSIVLGAPKDSRQHYYDFELHIQLPTAQAELRSAS